MGLLSSLSVPLRYDHGNSGRYLIRVLRAADPELFPDDPVADSLERFHSLFYDVLAEGARRAAIAPDEVEGLFVWLYGISRVLTILLVMAVAGEIDRDPVTVLWLGAWGCFTKSVPIGGDSLFVNVVTHGTVSFLLGAGAVWALLAGRRLGCWILLAVSLFVHPLMALHLALCLAPAQIVLRRRIDRIDVVGGIVFLVALAICSTTIPSLSAGEADLLVATKGAINHVALSAQGGLSWLKETVIVLVAVSAWWKTRGSAPSAGRDLLVLAVVCGAGAACLLSMAANGLGSARLVQLQPLRIFLWIHWLCFTLIASVAVRAWRRREPEAAPLAVFFVLSLIPTLWQYLFGTLALGALAVPRWRRAWIWATGIGVALVAAGWLSRDLYPSLETLRHPLVPALALLGLGAYGWAGVGQARHRAGLAAALLTVACGISAVSWHRYYDGRSYPRWGPSFHGRVDADWDVARRWIASRTPKNARFLVAGGRGNFRTLALRVGIGEPSSALAWVDPRLYRQVESIGGEVARSRVGGRWCLKRLAEMALRYDASYFLTEGETSASTAAPRFEIGAYRIYRAVDLRDRGEQ